MSSTAKAPGRWKLPPFKVEVVMRAQDVQETVDWGLQLAKVDQAWKITQGEDIGVAVLDTGVQSDHPDLKDAIADARDFTGSRNGFEDANGHGTHCGGIIAALMNGIGVIGVSPKSKLYVGKVLGNDGSGSDAGIINGIDWAASLPNVHIISMSLGSSWGSNAFRQSIIRAVRAGKFVIAAAGNDGRPNSVNYPAKWTDCIGVGAIDRNGKVAKFSSQGERVDIAAPGQDVLSTYINGSYAKLSGTSMATPFVAGVVALVLSRHKKLGAQAVTPIKTVDDLRNELKRTAIDAGPTGHDPAYGWGLINPESMIPRDETGTGPGTEPALEKILLDGVTLASGVKGSVIFRPSSGVNTG